jgi:urease accessory protein
VTEFSGNLGLLASRRTDGRTVLERQSFRAPFHLSKPYWDADAGALLVQVVNPTAGILAGDRLRSQIEVGAGAALVVTTPSASRVFRMRAGAAESTQRYSVAAGGWLWMNPEPLVPHAGSRFRQATQIELEPGAGLCLVDTLMPGRLGFGEAWAWDELRLELDLLVAGELVLRERFAPAASELRERADFYGTGPASCFANVLLVPAGDDPPLPEPALRALHRPEAWVGVSALRRAGWSVRIVASGPLALRDTLAELRELLAPVMPLLRCGLRKG